VDTIRVDVSYRPLRVGWAIRYGDLAAFRTAARLSYTLWGGRYSPILVVDKKQEELQRLVDRFRVDVIWPIGDAPEVRAFPERFPYLPNPFHHDSLFIGGDHGRTHAQVLDLYNAIEHLSDRPEWQAAKGRGVRLYSWRPDDPLADVLLVHFGGFPSTEEIGLDYRAMLVQAAQATEHAFAPEGAIPADALQHPTIAGLCRYGLQPAYTARALRHAPGFFVGKSEDFEDLVRHWNLRAANIPLLFVDQSCFTRYAEIAPAWEKAMRETVAHRHEWERDLAVWSRHEDLEAAAQLFPDMKLMRHGVDEVLWNGLNLQVPTMQLGDASVLGVVSREQERPRVSFALSEKPFSGDTWFHTQHLVASISCGIGLYGDDHYTLAPPHVPELNEFCGRTMHFQHDRLRLEPGRVGLIVDAADTDAFLYALPVGEMMERLFALAGYRATPSNAGLITRQLIARLGGLQGARVFKIPGVRRLLRTYGPTDAFTKKSALQLIACKDPENLEARFGDHEGLHIGVRSGDKLRPHDVFTYLAEKGVFRMGVELTCPSCRLASWTALDALKQRVVCELCGQEHDATRQLVNGEWHYRRSGIMGAERNAQGGVPVALTLQQLDTNLHELPDRRLYSPPLNLMPDRADLPVCEADFVWVIPRPHRMRTAVILGECKDQGPIRPSDFQADVENLRRAADALPRQRFKTFVLLSKLAPFTLAEIEYARALNDEYRLRAILLTARELEPYHIYERTEGEEPRRAYANSPEDLAWATFEMYFGPLGDIAKVGLEA
jgi:hypothetical protein